MLRSPMLSSTSSSAPRSPLLPSPLLRKSPHQYHSMGLRLPLFSYSYALFCTAKNLNSFRFISFRTLATKHPGWGIPCFSARFVHDACPDLIGALKSTRALTLRDPSSPPPRSPIDTSPRRVSYLSSLRSSFNFKLSTFDHFSPIPFR